MTLQVGVKILLKNNEGKYLALLRSKSSSIVSEHWDIPGGRIDTGASLFENLKREVKEETGLEIINTLNLITAQDILYEDKHVVRLTYTGFADGEITLSDEHTDYKWLGMDEIKKLEPMDSYVKDLIIKL